MPPERIAVVRLLPSEFDTITAWASLQDMSVSDLIREHLHLLPVDEAQPIRASASHLHLVPERQR